MAICEIVGSKLKCNLNPKEDTTFNYSLFQTIFVTIIIIIEARPQMK